MANEISGNGNSKYDEPPRTVNVKLKSLLRKCQIHATKREDARTIFEAERDEALVVSYEAYCHAMKFPSAWERVRQSDNNIAHIVDVQDPAILILYCYTYGDSDETRDWATWMRYAFLAKLTPEQFLNLRSKPDRELDIDVGNIKERFKTEFSGEYREWEKTLRGFW